MAGHALPAWKARDLLTCSYFRDNSHWRFRRRISMSCATYFQPFTDHLSQPTSADHAPILKFLAAGNRAEANLFVVYMEGVLGLSHSLKAAPSARPAPVVAQALQLVGVCNAYYSDRGEAEGATTVPSVAGVTSSGEIVIPPDAIADNAEISVPAGAVADPPSPYAQTFQASGRRSG
jgi:hypothetical protein